MPNVRELPSVTLQSVELWTIFHDELDLDGNGHLDSEEVRVALSKAGASFLRSCASSSCSTEGNAREGIQLAPANQAQFMTFLASSPDSHTVTFRDFRDVLLLLPRQVSPAEIYRFYMALVGADARGATKMKMKGPLFCLSMNILKCELP